MNPGSKLIAKGDLPCQLPVRVNSRAFHCLACSCWVVGSSAVGGVCCQPAVSLWSPSRVVLQLLRHQEFSSTPWVISVGLQQQEQQCLGRVPRAGWQNGFGVTGGLLWVQATVSTLMFSASLFPEVDLLWSSAGLAPSRAISFPVGRLRGLVEKGSNKSAGFLKAFLFAKLIVTSSGLSCFLVLDSSSF